MNTSILKDSRYAEKVEETIQELQDLNLDNEIENWETLILTIRSKSIYYSKIKNIVKRNLKARMIK